MAYVHGTYQVIEDTKDYAVGLMNDLKTAMSAVTPHVDNVYTGHNNAAMKLNAVSVDVEMFSKNDEGNSDSNAYDNSYFITISIRVHTNYLGRYNDSIKTARLLNSIDNYLSTHIKSGNYRIYSFGDAVINEQFEESQTVGGELTFVVTRAIDHTQA